MPWLQSFLLLNLFGIALIIGIVYWFWLYKPKTQIIADHEITIIVENGAYTPNRIQAKANQIIHLNFLRKDAAPCAEWVIFKELDESHELPIDQDKKITLGPLAVGDYEFSCQMGMYLGVISVTR